MSFFVFLTEARRARRWGTQNAEGLAELWGLGALKNPSVDFLETRFVSVRDF